jgi:hypothetical protein
MTSFKRFLAIFICLALAIICFRLGVSYAAMSLMVLAGVFEVAFWVYAFKRKKPKR